MNSSKNSSRKRQSSTTANSINVGADDENAVAGEYLLDRLRILLNRLQSTAEILQNWPETKGDDSKRVHAETSAELIASIRRIALGVRSVERHVNGTGDGGGGGGGGGGSASTEAFRTLLEEEYPIPLDLLDLLDVGQPTFGINPQCYARGLMVEALRQLSVLERRKRALSMLARSIEGGMAMDNAAAAAAAAATRARSTKEEGGGDDDETSKNRRKRKDFEAIDAMNKMRNTALG
jgi:hypothetical protein